jgi:hypothetical protein
MAWMMLAVGVIVPDSQISFLDRVTRVERKWVSSAKRRSVTFMSELHHISDSDFVRYHFDTIRGPELAMVEEHLLWCIYCARREAKSCAMFGPY